MGNRELFTLGTASQVPTKHRNHNSYFLRWDREGILFDPGEGTQKQMILAGIKASQITRICITHFHGDHCLGLPGVIQRLSLDNVTHPVTVHYPASGQPYFERLRHASIFAGLENLAPRPIGSEGVIVREAAFILEARALEHETDCYGFRIREEDVLRFRPEKLEAAGLKGRLVGELGRKGSVKVGDRLIRLHDVSEIRPGQAFAFIMDTKTCAGARKLAFAADLVVCESTFLSPETSLAEKTGHMTALQAGELARDFGARRLVLGHFSQRYEDPASFVTEAQRVHDDVVAACEPPDPGFRIPVPEHQDNRFHGEFEAHITISKGDPEAFRKACAEMGVKPILIELARGEHANQPMTSSRHQGELSVVRSEVDGLAERLRGHGFTVTRRKIEATIDARGVPETDEDTRGLSSFCYFEYHVRIRMKDGDAARLAECAIPHGGHVSRSAWSRSADDEERFVTLRVPRVGRRNAEEKFEALLHSIREGGFEIADERREYTVFDSNLEIDGGWLPS